VLYREPQLNGKLTTHLLHIMSFWYRRWIWTVKTVSIWCHSAWGMLLIGGWFIAATQFSASLKSTGRRTDRHSVNTIPSVSLICLYRTREPTPRLPANTTKMSSFSSLLVIVGVMDARALLSPKPSSTFLSGASAGSLPGR
jgi:hypothetical protein